MVHPHVRGEYKNLINDLQQQIGSSPRAWGIRSIALLSTALVRFIPTCVGNTILNILKTGNNLVHPHVRGEYYMLVNKILSNYGSSPRAWGIHLHWVL